MNRSVITRLNAYRIMWIFVLFDLPTNTKKERREASLFRKNLLKDGFTMLQYSIYIRHCVSRQNAEVHKKRIQKLMPDSGQVSIMMITDKQYSLIENYWGRATSPLAPSPNQLVLF